jgi:uncharacterized protein
MAGKVQRAAAAVRFGVRLTPKGGRDALEGWAEVSPGAFYLKARVRAVPEDGKANAALVELVSDALKAPKSSIRLICGATSRLKTLEVTGDADALAARLESYPDCAKR